ncbi:YraN family protein [Phaeovibrio sulfidiphilus]|uniref:UPF0102 protein IHV25_02660 n=1 Tax=Phaeovibrio sulfidiphilus TaxID=1220600 RepID=A0A8J6YUC4_9PROT|nr:YraN family protein [Phaeovibrio sulfidiphilus]
MPRSPGPPRSGAGAGDGAGARVRRGAAAETLCALTLWLDGWEILARRVRFGRGVAAGEIDIIARKPPVLAFVEVKARTRPDALPHALTDRQRRRIENGAAAWLAFNPQLPGTDVRFDLMSVTPPGAGTGGSFGRVTHLPDAWRPG